MSLMETILSVFLMPSQCNMSGMSALESNVLDTRDQLRRAEVLVRRVAAALAEVVHEVLRHFAERGAFFPEVHGDADAAGLRGADA